MVEDPTPAGGSARPRAYDRGAVAALSRTPIPLLAKGFGGCADTDGEAGGEVTGAALASRGASLHDGRFTFPLLVLRDGAVRHNIAEMARFARAAGVELAPHAKTTMAPQLFARQLDAGAWGLAAATLDQVRVYRAFGVRRIVLANELVDPAGAAWLANEIRTADVDVFACVDSAEGLRLLERAFDAVRPAGRPLGLLVELGHAGGRTGCRSIGQARALAADAARAGRATGSLVLAGVAGYEGSIGHDRSAATLAAVRAFCTDLRDLVAELRAAGLLPGPALVSAGGSAYPDVVAAALGASDRHTTVVLRSGSSVTHDDGLYEHLSPFAGVRDGAYRLRPALQLWAHVLSRPEPDLAVVGFGRRNAGSDSGLPVPLYLRPAAPSGAGDGGRDLPGREHARVTRLNDQHAFLEIRPDSPLRPGDLVGFGVSHPCTTIDRWRHLPLLDDDDRVVDVVATFF